MLRIDGAVSATVRRESAASGDASAFGCVGQPSSNAIAVRARIRAWTTRASSNSDSDGANSDPRVLALSVARHIELCSFARVFALGACSLALPPYEPAVDGSLASLRRDDFMA